MDTRKDIDKPGQETGLFGQLYALLFDTIGRWPVYAVRFERVKLLQLYRSAKGPAAIMMWTNLFWIVPIAMYSQYSSMYARELGLSKAEIGYLGAVTMAVSVLFYLVGGWLTDRLGYLRSILLFDALSWPLPMAILAVADHRWHFYAAALLVGTMTGVVPAWNAMFVLRVPPERRASAFAIHFLISTAPGLVLPLAGSALVACLGLVDGIRITYLATAWLTTAGILIRWKMLPATAPLRESTPDFIDALVDQFRLYFRMIVRPEMRAFMLALTLVNMDMFVGGTFVSMYCMEYLGLPQEHFGWVTTSASAVRLVAVLLLAPLITPQNTRRFFIMAAGFLAAGSLTYLIFLCRPGGLTPLLPTIIAASALWAVGGALWGPAITAQWVNLIPENIRSRLWGAHGATNQLLGAGALAAVGGLYSCWEPTLLIVFLMFEIPAIAFFTFSRVSANTQVSAVEA